MSRTPPRHGARRIELSKSPLLQRGSLSPPWDLGDTSWFPATPTGNPISAHPSQPRGAHPPARQLLAQHLALHRNEYTIIISRGHAQRMRQPTRTHCGQFWEPHSITDIMVLDKGTKETSVLRPGVRAALADHLHACQVCGRTWLSQALITACASFLERAAWSGWTRPGAQLRGQTLGGSSSSLRRSFGGAEVQNR